MNQQTQNVIERGRAAIKQGNDRKIVIRTKEGKQILQSSLTVVAGVGAFLLLTGFISWPIIVIAAIAGYAARLQVQLTEEEGHVSTVVIES